MQHERFTGLIAATHTPFHANGALRLEIIEKQAAALLTDGVSGVFVCGTTGEGLSMTVAERMQAAQRWTEVAKGTALRVIVHIGACALGDVKALASDAAKNGAAGVAMIAPSFFRPDTPAALAACCKEVAASCPDTPFFYYDIPTFTHVRLSMPEFLSLAIRDIPNYAGLKFTHDDLVTLQICLHDCGEQIDILSGIDELLLPALAIGVRGAVGSSYNFAAPIYHSLMKSLAADDLPAARRAQVKAIKLLKSLSKRGYTASCKALMCRNGIEVGPPRLPQMPLTAEQTKSLFAEFDGLESP